MCTYNVILRRVRVTIFVLEKQCIAYSECVCNLSYPAWKEHANLIFFDRFSKNTQILNFMKIRLVGAELSLAGRWTNGREDKQTDMTKLIVASHNFANELKKWLEVF